MSVSSQPFLDAARVPLAEGHDANRKLEMWRPGKALWDLRMIAPAPTAQTRDTCDDVAEPSPGG
jgi:hypothetical protein